MSLIFQHRDSKYIFPQFQVSHTTILYVVIMIQMYVVNRDSLLLIVLQVSGISWKSWEHKGPWHLYQVHENTRNRLHGTDLSPPFFREPGNVILLPLRSIREMEYLNFQGHQLNLFWSLIKDSFSFIYHHTHWWEN